MVMYHLLHALICTLFQSESDNSSGGGVCVGPLLARLLSELNVGEWRSEKELGCRRALLETWWWFSEGEERALEWSTPAHTRVRDT